MHYHPSDRQHKTKNSTNPPRLLLPPVLTNLQTQLHDTQASLTNHVDEVRPLEGVLTEHDATKREVEMLRKLH
jgi:hypothetical protein